MNLIFILPKPSAPERGGGAMPSPQLGLPRPAALREGLGLSWPGVERRVALPWGWPHGGGRDVTARAARGREEGTRPRDTPGSSYRAGTQFLQDSGVLRAQGSAVEAPGLPPRFLALSSSWWPSWFACFSAAPGSPALWRLLPLTPSAAKPVTWLSGRRAASPSGRFLCAPRSREHSASWPGVLTACHLGCVVTEQIPMRPESPGLALLKSLQFFFFLSF